MFVFIGDIIISKYMKIVLFIYHEFSKNVKDVKGFKDFIVDRCIKDVKIGVLHVFY